MSPEEQLIAVAEFHGFVRSQYCDGWYKDGYGTCYLKPGKNEQFERTPLLPNYPGDLNAMHEAEKVLSHDQMHSYGNTLASMIFQSEIQLEKDLGLRRKNDNELFKPNGFGWFEIAHATAAQRAEAFLKTLNLWKE